MATYQQLQDDVLSWLNRRDCASMLPGWTTIVETEIAETVRARCMVVSGLQAIDAPYISLPSDFATMESIRDAVSGEMLLLKDEWSGSWTSHYGRSYSGARAAIATPSTAYRLVADCIEFLPHPLVPNPPDPLWQPQQVLMGWYARPKPLVLPSDTNTVLETFYAIYLYGLCKMGAIWAQDDERAQQMDVLWQQVVTRANLYKQQSDYSGAPYRAEIATVF